MTRFGARNRDSLVSNALAASPLEIEQHLVDVHDEIEDAVEMLKDFASKAARAKSDYESAHAKAMLRARMNEDLRAASDREADAAITCAKERTDYLVADALHSAQKAVVSVKETQSMILLGLLRSVRGAIGER